MSELIIPKDYKSNLSIYDTQKAIKLVKDYFQNDLSSKLNLKRVTAPLFVDPSSGLNDNLNNVERPVSFDIKELNNLNAEVVQSLAKWKRYALKKYNFKTYNGLYTDMNAIRRDENLDNIHSIYVDQWDWEKVIKKDDRNINYLENTVKQIYDCIKNLEKYISSIFQYIKPVLPENIFFITSEKLLNLYPNLSPKEREYKIVKEKGAVFIEKIGKKLSNNKPHDLRSPDYDDWELNGDIIFYNKLLDIPYEISSMGIRVDENSLVKQLKELNLEDRLNLTFHKDILNKNLPYTIGGGIGQSRLCMFILKKAHIGEVQCSLWPKKMIQECLKNNIYLL